MKELIDLVDEHEIFGTQVWNGAPLLLSGALRDNSLFSSAELWSQLERPLLRRPYFLIMKDGEAARSDVVTTSRRTRDRTLSDLINIDAVRDAVGYGATVKLSQMEDWHPSTRALLRELETRVAAELKAYVFYTPGGHTGALPHRDGAHVLVVQLEGTKRWRLYATDDQIDARPGLDVDTSKLTHDFVMHPGDVLYLPHGCPHAPSAEDEASLHMTITMTEPSPADLCQALIDAVADHRPVLSERAPTLRNDDRVEATLEALLGTLENIDSAELTAVALKRMRRRERDRGL